MLVITPGGEGTRNLINGEVLEALGSPGVTHDQVGEIIAPDAALTAEVLRLTNSAYLGLPRNITDPVEAVKWLGLETVKALVMALRFLAEHSHLKPGYLSFDQIWQHSIQVALIARDLVLFETDDRALASQALTAGLLHDLGKVVLVSTEQRDVTERLFPVRIGEVPEPWEGITSLLVPQALTLGMIERTGCRLPPRFQYGVMEQ